MYKAQTSNIKMEFDTLCKIQIYINYCIHVETSEVVNDNNNG